MHTPKWFLLPPCIIIALVWLMGASFSVNDTLESLHSSAGQIVKSVCYFAGSTYLLYELGQLLYLVLKGDKSENYEGKLAQIYHRNPFMVSFFAILLLWLPHIIISYPGYINWDAWSQLTQFFGNSDFTTHHPPAHTVFLGLFVKFGLKLGNANIGIYLSVLCQSVTAASILAYSLSLMEKWISPRWLRLIAFFVIVLVPYYTDYAVVAIKDTLYSVFFLLFVTEIICMLENQSGYFSDRKHLILLSFSIMGTFLFRHNGKYILYPTILALMAYFIFTAYKYKKKDFRKVIVLFLAPVLIANLILAAMITHYNIHKSSIGIGNALSFPLQQTARYVKEFGDEVTEEEAEAIRAVADYDNMAQKYNPRVADPIKNFYRGRGKRALLRYIKVWIKMFLKHPKVYIKATMNQNYYLLYPFTENDMDYDVVYTETIHEIIPWIERVNGKLGIHEVEALQNSKNIVRGLYKTAFSLPVLGMLSHQAPYCILLLFLTVFALYKKLWCLIIALLPLWLSLAIVILAPVIQGHPRYAFPIVYTMPIIAAYYVRLQKHDAKPK